jgi:hypothetical protein
MDQQEVLQELLTRLNNVRDSMEAALDYVRGIEDDGRRFESCRARSWKQLFCREKLTGVPSGSNSFGASDTSLTLTRGTAGGLSDHA